MSLAKPCWQCGATARARSPKGTHYCPSCRIVNPDEMPEPERIMREVAACRRATTSWLGSVQRANLALYSYEDAVFLAHPDHPGSPIIWLTEDKGQLE